MVYICYLIHSTRMKTKGKELVKIIDISDSCALEIFPVAVNINICWNNTIQKYFEVKQKTINQYVSQKLHSS